MLRQLILKNHNSLMVIWRKQFWLFNFIHLMLFAFLLLSFNSETIVVSTNIQKIILSVLSIFVFSSIHNQFASMMINVFDVQLKLISLLNLKIRMYLKLSYITTIIYLIVRNLEIFDQKHFLIFTFLLLCEAIFTSFSGIKKKDHIILVILYSSFIFLRVPFIILWIFFGVCFITTNLITVNITNLLTYSYIKNNGICSNSESLYKYTNQSQHSKNYKVTSSVLSFFKYKFFCNLKFLFWTVIICTTLSLIILELDLKRHLYTSALLVIYIFSNQLLEQITTTELKMLNNKAFSIKLVIQNLRITYLVYSFYTLMIVLFYSIFIMNNFSIIFIMISIFIIILQIIKQTKNLNRGFKSHLIDFIFTTIMISLSYLLL